MIYRDKVREREKEREREREREKRKHCNENLQKVIKTFFFFQINQVVQGGGSASGCPGVNIIKLFIFSTDTPINKLECLPLSSFFSLENICR